VKKIIRSWTLIVALLALTFVLAACQPASPASAPAAGQQQSGAPAEQDQPLRIAVVLPGKPNDYGISHGVYDAIMEYQAMHGRENVVVAISENNFVVDNAATAIRDYASQGYDIIVAPSSSFGSILQETAPDFPNTSFVWGTTPETYGLPNIYAFVVNADHGGYVQGVIAASVADKIGVVMPLNVGSIARTTEGFQAGVQATNPDAEVLVTFTGAFGDIVAANQAARTMADAGAQILVSQTEIATGAATVARERNIPFMGNNSDFTPFAPEVTYASSDYKYGVALHQIFDQIREGKLGGEMLALSLDNGGIEIVFNDRFPLPEEARRAAEEAIEGLKSGRIQTGMSRLP
jgi:basic membrane lipoprotein Med (substrate-binding protein (PBP1-ABC) superfamily)